MVGWSQYRQPGSRTSPSIQRQVRAGLIGGAGCRGGARRSVRVIAPPSAGRSAGRSPGRRGRVKTPAMPPSHRVQAQGLRERLPGVIAASYGAFWPPPKSRNSSSSRSWRDCTMLRCGDVAPVAGNGWGSACPTFCNVRQILRNCLRCRRGDGRTAAVRSSRGRGWLGGVRILGPVGETTSSVRAAEHNMSCVVTSSSR